MKILYVDGIGSNQANQDTSQSILYRVASRLHDLNPNASIERVVWPASMATVGGPFSWRESTKIGVQDLLNRVKTSSEVILLGYSGGCRVVHEWLENHNHYHNRILAVGQLSDPYRPRDRKQFELSPTRGWGIMGEKIGPLPDRTFWTTVPGDVISDALPDSLLRTVADASGVMPGEFLAELYRKMASGDLQLAWQLGVFQTNPLTWLSKLGPRLDQARVDLTGYFTGRHTTDYIIPHAGGASLAVRLANSINWSINN